jgi:glycine dehydrogenase subunit 1
MRYLPHTDQEIRTMLERIGVSSIDALFESIPKENRLGRPLAIEPGMDELSLQRHLAELANKNAAKGLLSFLGGGIYDHHIPPAVDQLLLRSEFYTAYTPYQAEIAQGTLQSIFEFQTLVSEIYGMEVANASMYDGASAAAEAVLMARRLRSKTRVVVSAAVHPHYRETIRTYLSGLGSEDAIREVPIGADGRTDLAALKDAVNPDTAAVLVATPNFLGYVEELDRVRDIAKSADAIFIVANSEPYAFSVLSPPGRYGADIVVGEGQPMAVPPQFGAPGVGLFAARGEHVRQMPGRLVGETLDSRGERGYVLTLSTREQHIRRERATSNICTNHGLIALAFTIRTAMLGKRGYREVGELCLSKTEYLKSRIEKAKKHELVSRAPTFNEVAIRVRGATAAARIRSLAQKGILAGLDLGRFYPERSSELLVAVTEKHRKEDIDQLVDALEAE